MKYAILLAFVIFSFGKINAQSEYKITQKKETYRLVISFISKGSGIDGKTAEKVEGFLKNHPKKPAYETCRMGREGEFSYLLQLKELPKHEQKKFIKELEEQVGDKDLVHISENKLFESPCRG
jgi:hypothetical protein